MSHKDYTKFSKREYVELKEPETITEEPATQPAEPKMEPKQGVVTDCVKLNVRANPNSKAEVVCEVTAKTELLIDEVNSTEDFYKVITAAGVEGFCMKKFITLIP